jgi:5'-nucleotidase (lipoprotein e(P4) family)
MDSAKNCVAVRVCLALAFSFCFAGAAAAQTRAALDNEYQAGATLWYQTSGEARALYYQGFNLARMMLDRDLRVNRGNRRPRALVVDVDETVLDNSRFQTEQIKRREGYSGAAWTDWCKREQATAVPGAVEFLKYASSRGVRVFYITNRNQNERQCTAENLNKLGFPVVNDQTLLVRTDPATSSKEPRRQSVASRYRIILLMGDNLNDFTNLFEKRTVEDRNTIVDNLKTQFGSRFIMLPNPMYGDWESAVYGYNPRLSEEEKAKMRKERLKGY